jgi:hypothetical protein
MVKKRRKQRGSGGDGPALDGFAMAMAGLLDCAAA